MLASVAIKGKGMFLYSAVSSPLDRSKRFTLYPLPPGRPVHSDTNSASQGSILAMQQLPAKTIHSHLPHHLLLPGIHLYRCVNRDVVERMKMPELRNGSMGDSNPDSFDCESGILPLSLRTPLIIKCEHEKRS